VSSLLSQSPENRQEHSAAQLLCWPDCLYGHHFGHGVMRCQFGNISHCALVRAVAQISRYHSSCLQCVCIDSKINFAKYTLGLHIDIACIATASHANSIDSLYLIDYHGLATVPVWASRIESALDHPSRSLAKPHSWLAPCHRG